MKKNKKPISLKKLIILIIIVWLISAFSSWILFKYVSDSEKFAETFNIINSLFSGLALATIIYTVYLQKTELSLQRKELKYTRGELKRTANAQELSISLMNEQIRLNNLPFLQYNSATFNDQECLIISNESEHSAFDIDIWLFITEDISNVDPYKFIEIYGRKEWKEKIKLGPLVDDSLWGLAERGIYHSFPKNKEIIIPINYPVGYGAFDIYIQYRDCLSNNYSFNIYFRVNGSEKKPFTDAVYNPKVPTITKRIDFTDKEVTEKDLPVVAKGLINLKNASIMTSFLALKQFQSVENKWEMKVIEGPANNIDGNPQ